MRSLLLRPLLSSGCANKGDSNATNAMIVRNLFIEHFPSLGLRVNSKFTTKIVSPASILCLFAEIELSVYEVGIAMKPLLVSLTDCHKGKCCAEAGVVAAKNGSLLGRLCVSINSN